MPNLAFPPLPSRAAIMLRLGTAVGRLGNGVEIRAGLVKEINSLDDVSICNTIQIGSGFLVLVLLAHAAAQCQVSRKLGERGRRTGNGRNSRERRRGRKREGE